MPQRYLTKSLFKQGLDCPAKLYYTKKSQYADKKLDNDFLTALANGGFQVGELAKCYFPGGHQISDLDYETALINTNQLLREDDVIIYEAAVRYGNLFIRVDILVKNGTKLSLYEVKAKSADSIAEKLTNADGLPNSKWKPYICEVAFQKYVVENAFPDFNVSAFLMVADKSVTTSVEGLNQKFMLADDTGRKLVKRIGDVSAVALGKQILVAIPLNEVIDSILSVEKFEKVSGKSFVDLIHFYAKKYVSDEMIQGDLKAACKNCEFKTTIEEERKGMRSGFKECWKLGAGFSDQDFLKPSVLDVWNSRSKDKFIKERRFFQSDLVADDFVPKKENSSIEFGLKTWERQLLQIKKSTENGQMFFMDVDGLKYEFETFTYPLHFIDFETSSVAIPFNINRHPYEQIAFQFSHHVVYQDGTIEHKGEWINTEQGKFPNFEFVRMLKAELGNDEGTIFRYAAHENSILNAIYRQLRVSDEYDQEQLCTWIKTITQSTTNSDESWIGQRNMVDLCDLVKKYYYSPQTNGSNSIKAILPAILNQSDFLREKYGKPIYGDVIKSKNFTRQSWIVLDEGGNVINPYKHLQPIFTGIDADDLDELLSDSDAEVSDGGAAMMAYAQIQFTQMTDFERELITKSLLKYCELDTLAMVMIWEEWNYRINYI